MMIRHWKTLILIGLLAAIQISGDDRAAALSAPDGITTPTPLPPSWQLGDFDDSSCTGIEDFLYLLDYWQTEVNGYVMNITDFLHLLDYWNEGTACPITPTPTPTPEPTCVQSYVPYCTANSTVVYSDQFFNAVRPAGSCSGYDIFFNGHLVCENTLDWCVVPSGPCASGGDWDVRPSASATCADCLDHPSIEGSPCRFVVEPWNFDPPTIAIYPPSGTFLVGETINVTIAASVECSGYRGAALSVVFDPMVLSLDGLDSVQIDPGSPFEFSSEPEYIGPNKVQMGLIDHDFQIVNYSGPLLTLKFVCIAFSVSTDISFEPSITRFAPDIPGTILSPATYVVVLPTPTP